MVLVKLRVAYLLRVLNWLLRTKVAKLDGNRTIPSVWHARTHVDFCQQIMLKSSRERFSYHRQHLASTEHLLKAVQFLMLQVYQSAVLLSLWAHHQNQVRTVAVVWLVGGRQWQKNIIRVVAPATAVCSALNHNIYVSLLSIILIIPIYSYISLSILCHARSGEGTEKLTFYWLLPDALIMVMAISGLYWLH